MKEQKTVLRSTVMNIIETLYQGEALKANGRKINHKSCAMIEQVDDVYAFSGSYYVEDIHGLVKRELLYYTLVLKRENTGKIKIRHLHISADLANEKRYHIKDIRERVFMIEEDELLYLEACHNHIIWHCKYFVVESVGSLKKLEEELSGSFVRIQRSYIVNKKHVRKIARCYAEMDNKEIIQIPVKKYCNIKNTILKTKGD